METEITSLATFRADMKTLGEFLLAEIQKRHMSAREFAQFVGVSHKTINKFLNHGTKDVGQPSVDFLVKLSKATNTDLCAIMALVAPDAVDSINDAEARMILSRIRRLGADEQRIIEAFIVNAAFGGSQPPK